MGEPGLAIGGRRRRLTQLGGTLIVPIALIVDPGMAPPAAGEEPCAPAQSHNWLEQFGTAGHDLGRDITVDSARHAVYVTGYTTGAFPGWTNPGGWDAFLARYNREGEQLWLQQFGASSDDRGIGVAVDETADGAPVYVAGITHGRFPGQVYTGGGADAFLIKFNADGEQLWVRQYGAGNSDQSYRVAVDGAGGGAVYTTGSTLGAFPGEQNFGDRDAFIARFTSEGDLLWVRQLGSSEGDSGPALGVDAEGNAYIAGYTTGAFPGMSFAGEVDTFIARYSPDGEQVWLRQFGTAVATIATDVAVDAHGHVYICGQTGGAFPGENSAGGTDAFVASFHSTGGQRWVRQFGTSGTDRAYGIDVDEDGILHIAGNSTGAFAGYQNQGGEDLFLARLSAAGELLSVVQFGTGADDYCRALALTTHWSESDRGLDGDDSGEPVSNAEVYLTGRTLGSLPGYSSSGGLDAFVVSWPACATTLVIPADLNADGVVNVLDLLILLGEWGACPDCAPGACPADLDHDCNVNVSDLLILLANWG